MRTVVLTIQALTTEPDHILIRIHLTEAWVRLRIYTDIFLCWRPRVNRKEKHTGRSIPCATILVKNSLRSEEPGTTIGSTMF